MKEIMTIAAFVTGFMVLISILTFIGMDFAFNRMESNKYWKGQITPIVVQCPDNTKQIIVPDASKLTL